MKKLLPIVCVLAAACSRQSEAPTAPPAAAPAAPAKTLAAEPLDAERAARLIRDHSPVLGPKDAPVTIVEFLDPACGACRAFAPIVKQIQFLHPDEVRVVVRYAAFHQGSDEAVRLLDAAHRQGKFETVLGALFDGQEEWASHHAPDPARAWQLAAAAGLDVSRARQQAASRQAADVLRIDGEDVVALRVDSTPTFYVNGRLLTDFGVKQLFALVDEEVKRVRDAGGATE